jgi:hypothetical protein
VTDESAKNDLPESRVPELARRVAAFGVYPREPFRNATRDSHPRHVGRLRGRLPLSALVFPLIATACGSLELVEGTPSKGEAGAPREGGVDATEAASLPDATDAEPRTDATGDCREGLVILASGQDEVGVGGLAVDSTNVYWTKNVSGTVMKVPKCGGVPSALASEQNGLWAIAVDGTSVYWTTSSTNCVGTGTVMKVGLDGGKPITLASSPCPSAITVDAQSVYWTDSLSNTVEKVSLRGGRVTTLASGQEGPSSIAVDAESVYWTNGANGGPHYASVVKVALKGGTPATLGWGQAYADGIAVGAIDVYWTNMGTDGYGTVVKTALGGGTPATLVSPASQQVLNGGIVVDATNVYWVNSGALSVTPYSGAVMRKPQSGGTPTTLVSAQFNPLAIAVDATSVYWTSTTAGPGPSTGTVVARAPK